MYLNGATMVREKQFLYIGLKNWNVPGMRVLLKLLRVYSTLEKLAGQAI